MCTPPLHKQHTTPCLHLSLVANTQLSSYHALHVDTGFWGTGRRGAPHMDRVCSWQSCDSTDGAPLNCCPVNLTIQSLVSLQNTCGGNAESEDMSILRSTCHHIVRDSSCLFAPTNNSALDLGTSVDRMQSHSKALHQQLLLMC